MEGLWWPGFYMVGLTVAPLLLYILSKDFVNRWRLLKFIPAIIRLLFVFLFADMARMVQRKYELSKQFKEDVELFEDTNKCVDEYSQIKVDPIL